MINKHSIEVKPELPLQKPSPGSVKLFLIAEILVSIGILPHLLIILSWLVIQVGSTLGICVPVADLYSGLCSIPSAYTLVYYLAISNNPNLILPFFIILLAGLILVIISYAKRKKGNIYINKTNHFFMIIGFMGVVFSSIFLPGIYHYDSLNPNIPGDCDVYIPITGPDYKFSAEDNQLIQYKKQEGCGDNVSVRILYCRTYANDPNNLSADEQKKVEWLKQRCANNSDNIYGYGWYQYVQIWPNCTVYTIYSGIYSDNPEEFPEIQKEVESLKENGCKNVYIKPDDQKLKEIKYIRIDSH